MKRILIGITALILIAGVSFAEVPQHITIQGRLMDSEGKGLGDKQITKIILGGTTIYGDWSPLGSAYIYDLRNIKTEKDGFFSFPLSSILYRTAIEAFKQGTATAFKVIADGKTYGHYLISSVPYSLNASTLNGMTTTEIINIAGQQTPISPSEQYWSKSGNAMHTTDPLLNIGIANTNPKAKLDVEGTIRAKGIASSNPVGGAILTGEASYGLLAMGRYYGGMFESQNGYGIHSKAPKNYFSGKIGIGIDNPNAELHAKRNVSGNVNIKVEDKDGSFGAFGVNDSGNYAAFSHGTDQAPNWDTIVMRDNKVGIGTNDPGAKLHVAGNLKVDGELIGGNVWRAKNFSYSVVEDNWPGGKEYTFDCEGVSAGSVKVRVNITPIPDNIVGPSPDIIIINNSRIRPNEAVIFQNMFPENGGTTLKVQSIENGKIKLKLFFPKSGKYESTYSFIIFDRIY